MKDFMMIFIGEDYESLGFSNEELQQRMGKWFTWHEKMEAQGIVVHGEALKSDVRTISGASRTVNNFHGTEVKELIGGYYVIKANSFDEVERIAQDFPDYDLGSSVEIREIMVFDQ